MSAFKPGQTYPMRGGGEFHVFEVFEGKIFGRSRVPGAGDWASGQRFLDGRLARSAEGSLDLPPPMPEIVVSDAVAEVARREARRPGATHGTTLRAAIDAWLREPAQAPALEALRGEASS